MNYRVTTRPTLGVDIGGTNMRLVRLGAHEDATVVRLRLPAEPALRWATVLDLIEHHSRGVASIGVAVAGVVRKGRVEISANSGAEQIDLAEAVRARTGMTPTLLNDAQAAALAEARELADTSRITLVITLGTGIGSGVLLDGDLVHGEGFAGEIGHMRVDPDGALCGCGSIGCWEAVAAGRAIQSCAVEMYPWLSNTDALTRLGADPGADGEIAAFAEAFCSGLESVNWILSPARIIIGGGLLTHSPRIRRAYLDRIGRSELLRAVEMRPAILGDDAGAIGAAWSAATANDLV